MVGVGIRLRVERVENLAHHADARALIVLLLVLQVLELV
jgi:hypothetical protein